MVVLPREEDNLSQHELGKLALVLWLSRRERKLTYAFKETRTNVGLILTRAGQRKVTSRQRVTLLAAVFIDKERTTLRTEPRPRRCPRRHGRWLPCFASFDNAQKP